MFISKLHNTQSKFSGKEGSNNQQSKFDQLNQVMMESASKFADTIKRVEDPELRKQITKEFFDVLKATTDAGIEQGKVNERRTLSNINQKLGVLNGLKDLRR